MIYKKSKSGRVKTYARCLCDCGNIKDIAYDSLVSKHPVTSCGCDFKEKRSKWQRRNDIGKKFNRLKILDIDWESHPIMARCLCDCGNEITIVKSDVTSGHTRSCGCLQKESAGDANAIDYSGMVSPSGVLFIRKYRRNEHNQWLWECKCPCCGELFVELPSRVNNGHKTSCGCSTTSSGERMVSKILDDIGVCYVKQYSFLDCTHIYRLRFDFAIFIDGVLSCLIEYDGEQHDAPIDFFGGESAFNKQKQRDLIKDNYCLDNSYPLLRIQHNMNIQDIKSTIINTIYP